MISAEWLSYLGAVTGVVGAITGIAGAIMGYLSYRKSGEIKSLELRLELMKTGLKAFQKADDLGDLLARAERSRKAVAAAMGSYKSGAHERWMRQLAADEESLASINESVDELNIDYSKAPLRDLEKATGELHALQTIVQGISERYVSSIAEDERNRMFLRDHAHAKVNS